MPLHRLGPVAPSSLVRPEFQWLKGVCSGSHEGASSQLRRTIGAYRYPLLKSYDIFEGTEHIQQLVISRGHLETADRVSRAGGTPAVEIDAASCCGGHWHSVGLADQGMEWEAWGTWGVFRLAGTRTQRSPVQNDGRTDPLGDLKSGPLVRHSRKCRHLPSQGRGYSITSRCR
jgi:hypothetical protein